MRASRPTIGSTTSATATAAGARSTVRDQPGCRGPHGGEEACRPAAPPTRRARRGPREADDVGSPVEPDDGVGQRDVVGGRDLDPGDLVAGADDVGVVDHRRVGLAEPHLGQGRLDVDLAGDDVRGDAGVREDLVGGRAAGHRAGAEHDVERRVRRGRRGGDPPRVVRRGGDLDGVAGDRGAPARPPSPPAGAGRAPRCPRWRRRRPAPPRRSAGPGSCSSRSSRRRAPRGGPSRSGRRAR